MLTRRKLLFLPLVVAVSGLAIASVACQISDSIKNPLVVTSVPWPNNEEARYVLKDRDGGEVARAILKTTRQGDGGYSLTQRFESEKITDELTTLVKADLKPVTVKRVVSGDEGDLRIEAHYKDGRVAVTYTSPSDLKSREAKASPDIYDNSAALFLWRTIPFAQGYETGYSSIASALVRNPEKINVSVKVMGKETVAVPAGTFESWRVEIRGGGFQQVAWYDTGPQHRLVKYDNQDQVFLLESASP